MLFAILVLIVPALIVFVAVRIVLGWILTPYAMRAVDNFTHEFCVFGLKLIMVGFGALILWAVYIGATAPHPPM